MRKCLISRIDQFIGLMPIMELHELKTTVTIGKVSLNIRFPGSLSFQLKSPHLYQDIEALYPLSNGQCQVSESVTFTSEVAYDPETQQYKQANVDLCISINTTSGKILAGVVTFNAAQNRQDRFALRRCSDKRAAVEMKISFEKVAKLDDIEGQIKTETQEMSPIRQAASEIKGLPSGITAAKLKLKIQERRNSSSSRKKIIEPPRSSRSKHDHTDSRVRELEENNDRRVRIVLQEKKEIQDQLDKVKEKLRLCQRRQKQAQVSLKQMKDANDKKKLKITELQHKQLQNDSVIFEQDKRIRKLMQELKEANNSISSYELKVAALEKKVEMKEQAFVEREKKLLEKISQIQSNSSKGLQDYNILLEKMETQEKLSQATLKNKEKIYIEEKLKWKEQSEQQQQQIARVAQLNDELLAKVDSMGAADQLRTKQLNDLTNQLEGYKVKLESLTAEIGRSRSAKQQCQRQLGDLRAIESDKTSLKKRMQEQAQENQKMKDKLDKLMLDHQQLKENFRNDEELLEALKKEKKNIEAKNRELERTNADLQKSITQLQGENNSLSSKNTYFQERLNDFKTKLEQRERQFTDEQLSSNNTINSILQSKEYLMADLEDLKWALEKEKNSLHETQAKLKSMNQLNMTKEEEILKLHKENEGLRIHVEEHQTEISSLKEELVELKKKERENLDIVKDKDYKIYELSKRVTQLEQENFIAISKLNSSNASKDSTISEQLTLLQSLNQQLRQAKAKLQDSSRQYEELEDRHRQLERNFKQQTLSLEESDRLCSQMEDNYNAAKKESNSFRKKLEDIEEKKNFGDKQYDQKITSLTRAVQEAEKELKEKNKDLATYKSSVQQLLLILSSDKQNNEETVAVPDSDLSRNQLEALGTRNKNIARANELRAELELEINYLQRENENKVKLVQEKEEKLEKEVKLQGERLLELETIWKAEKAEQLQETEALQALIETLRTDKQKVQAKLKGLEELFEEKKQQNAQLQHDLEHSMRTIVTLEASLLETRQRQITKKSEDQTVLHNVKTELHSQIQLYKEKVNSLLKQKEALEKSLGEKEKIISSKQARVTALQSQAAQIEQRLKSTGKNLEQRQSEKSSLQVSLQAQKTTCQQLDEQVARLQLQLRSQQELRKQYERKLSESRTQLEQVSVEKEQLIHRFNQTKQTSSATNEQLRSKIVVLEENLQAECKRSASLSTQLATVSSEIQLRQFESQQRLEEIDQHLRSINSLREQNEQKKHQNIELQRKNNDLQNKLMASQKEKHEFELERNHLSEELQLLKATVQEHQIQKKELHHKIEAVERQLDNSKSDNEKLSGQAASVRDSNSELRQALNATKKELQLYTSKAAELRSRLAIVQEQLKEREQFYQTHKSKNWEESQKEISNLRNQFKQYQSELKKSQALSEQQKQSLQAQLQQLLQEKEDLEFMLDDRDALIERQEEQIFAAQNRIISLNAELRSCLEAWEKEKAAAQPSRKQTVKIQQDLARFQQLANDLNKKTKQSINLVDSRAKDDALAKMGQDLVDLLDLQHRSRVKVLSSLAESEKKMVSSEYDKVKSKIEEILKSHRGEAVTDSA